jgi:hypothetical protein
MGGVVLEAPLASGGLLDEPPDRVVGQSLDARFAQCGQPSAGVVLVAE